jgi:DNA-binding MarR family transcriptional regulator
MADDEEMLLRFARIIAADGYDRGLKPAQWQALKYLEAANRFSRTPKALTSWLDQTKGSVSQTLLALEAKGLVSRRTDPDDQRVVRLDLTDAGRAVLSGPPPGMASDMLSTLSAKERAQFGALATKMLVGSLRRRGGRPFGACRDCKHFGRAEVSPSTHRCRLLDVPLTDFDAQAICVEQEPV